MSRGADGSEFGFNGEYREIVVPERVVHTEIFEPYPDSPALVTMTLESRGEQTYYQSLVQHDSQMARDMHVQSGMEYGANLALDRLESIARSLVRATQVDGSRAPAELR